MSVDLSKKKSTSVKALMKVLWLPVSTFACIALYVYVASNLDPIYDLFAGFEESSGHSGFWFFSSIMWGGTTFFCLIALIASVEDKNLPDDPFEFACLALTTAYAAYSFVTGGVAVIWLLWQMVPAGWNWLSNHNGISYVFLVISLCLSIATYCCRHKLSFK